MSEKQNKSGGKPDRIPTVNKVFSAVLTLAGAVVCILIVRYFHLRSVGITPEIGVFSTLAGQALKSESIEEEPAPESEAQDAVSGDDQASSLTDPSASDVPNETEAAGSDQDESANIPDQSVPDGEEATGFDPAALYPASQDQVSPVSSSPDPAYSDPAYSDQAYSDPASQDPASYDPAYPGQEDGQDGAPAESDWESFEEVPEEETEWNPIEEGDPDWEDQGEPDEDMEEDEDYEDYED